MLLRCFIFLAFAAVLAPAKTKIKDLVQQCNVYDDKFQECVTTSARRLVPRISQGIPTWNMWSFNPLVVPRVWVGEGKGPVRMEFEFINSTHAGLDQVIVRNVSVDFDNKDKPKLVRFTLNLTVPAYNMYGKYKTHGQILVLPLDGEGVGNVSLTDLGVDFVLDTSPKTRAGQKTEYLHIRSMTGSVHMTKNYIRLDNLFGGNKVLGDVMNNFLNKNQKEINMYLLPAFNEAFIQVYQPIIQQVFDNIPFLDMFLRTPTTNRTNS